MGLKKRNQGLSQQVLFPGGMEVYSQLIGIPPGSKYFDQEVFHQGIFHEQVLDGGGIEGGAPVFDHLLLSAPKGAQSRRT